MPARVSDEVKREKNRIRQARYRAKNPYWHRRWRLPGRYGITLDEYNEMLAKQNEVCAICLGPETRVARGGGVQPLSVDHCHATNKVRGLLCNQCNTGLGKFKDSPDFLREAADYLDRANE